MGGTVVFSDEDSDGMCAAKIVSGATNATTLFQKWNIFGVQNEDVDKIRSYDPSSVYLLDLGSGLQMLDVALTLLSENINVTILDNHPPDPRVETSEDMSKFSIMLTELRKTFKDKFFYDSTTESCTTGLAYELFREKAPIDIRWALIGLIGDVATDPERNPRGYALYSNLLKVSPYLTGLFMAKSDGASYDFGLLNFYAKLLHVPRRMVFDAAPPLLLEAMTQMEKIPNWIEFNRLLGVKDPKAALDKSPLFKDGKNNSVKAILLLQTEWEKEHGKAENRGESTLLHYPDFDVTILSHEWNLGSALASKRLGMSVTAGKPKAQFVINDIPGQEIHISGRGPDKTKVQATTSEGSPVAGVFRNIPGLHIGKVFRLADPSIMTGGGLQPAGSSRGLVNDPEILLNELVKAVTRAKS